jgi:hypothetical protein
VAALITHLEGRAAATAILLAFSALFLVVHAALKWWAWAFRPMRALWFALAVLALGALWRTPIVALLVAALPLAVCIELLVLGHRLSDYVRGIPDRDDGGSASTGEFDGLRCRTCGEGAARIIAPVWCMSFVFLSARRLGRPRLVCERHARLRALPAAAVSMIVGWWGIPWGVLWTPVAVWKDLSRGGVEVDRDSALESVAEEGPLAIDRRHVLLFALSVGALVLLLVSGRATNP